MIITAGKYLSAIYAMSEFFKKSLDWGGAKTYSSKTPLRSEPRPGNVAVSAPERPEEAQKAQKR